MHACISRPPVAGRGSDQLESLDSQPSPKGDQPPRNRERAAVLPYLAQLLANGAFEASPRRRKLLAYVVEQTLAGHGTRLKAFDIALAVLGRDERFDAQNDPIVRIEVGRLRRDLDHYYATAGRADPIRISIPKGHYVPAFAPGESSAELEPAPPPAPSPTLAPPQARPRRPRLGYAAMAALLLALLAADVWRWAPWRDEGETAALPQAAGPAVVVQPFAALAGGDDGQLLAGGLTSGLIADLMRFDGMEVFAGEAAVDGSPGLPPAAAGTPVYVIAGSVERAPDRVRVTARLTERASSEVLWSQSYDRELTPANIFEVESDLTGAIVGRLAQGYGVISTDAAKRMQRAPPATLFAYDCVQRAFAYRRGFVNALYPPVRACLEEAVRRDPNYATAWAMLAFAHLDAARFGMVEPAAKPFEMQAGLAAAQRAVELAPTSVTSLQSLAALQFMSGEREKAEALQRQAIALNPHDPESLAQLGWRLGVSGRPAESARLLQTAVDRSVSPPAWYQANLALAYFLMGDMRRALDRAVLGKDTCCGVGQFILALAEQGAGNDRDAHAAFALAVQQAPVLGHDPPAFMRNFGVTEEVIARLKPDLIKAGLTFPP